jgi:arabinofuranosyltransferase
LIAIALMVPVRHYLTDDTFIHLQYARHLAAGDGLVFNTGERVYGCTSPLWVILLAAGMALGADGVGTARALGAIATLASVVLFFMLMRRTLRNPAVRAFATVTWACHAWMLRWSLSGMETPLAVALLLAGFVAFTDGERWGSRPALTGAIWSLLALTRPEGLLLLLMWGVYLAREVGSEPGRQRFVKGIAPPVVLYGGWLLFARLYFGRFWTTTLAAKTAGSVDLAYRVASVRRAAMIVAATDGALVAVLIAALIFGRRGSLSRSSRRPESSAPPSQPQPAGPSWVPWVWVVLVPVLYIASGIDVLSRYLLLILPVVGWLAWRAAETWWQDDRRKPRRLILLGGALAAIAVAQNAAVYAMAVLPQVSSFTRGIEQSLIPLGEWFLANSPPSATIAAPDIGAIGYFSRRRVLDTTGLVTPRMIPILEHATLEDAVGTLRFASFERPGFVVDRADSAFDLLVRSPYAVALTPVGHVGLPNLGIMRPGRAVYTAYRIDWRAYDALVKLGR